MEYRVDVEGKLLIEGVNVLFASGTQRQTQSLKFGIVSGFTKKFIKLYEYTEVEGKRDLAREYIYVRPEAVLACAIPSDLVDLYESMQQEIQGNQDNE